MTSAPPNPGDRSASTGDAPPRAFAQGTGILLQTVGVLMFLSSCCVFSLTGIWSPVQPDPQVIESIRTNTTPEPGLRGKLREPSSAGYMITALATSAGGLAIAVFGLGLQADRRRAANGAVFASITMTLLLLVAGALLWTGNAGFVPKLWNLALLAIAGLLVAFTVAALRNVRANPPPANVDIVPPGTKIPYSWYHNDPPDVRLARELEARRERLDTERLELEKLERELAQRKESEKN